MIKIHPYTDTRKLTELASGRITSRFRKGETRYLCNYRRYDSTIQGYAGMSSIIQRRLAFILMWLNHVVPPPDLLPGGASQANQYFRKHHPGTERTARYHSPLPLTLPKTSPMLEAARTHARARARARSRAAGRARR